MFNSFRICAWVLFVLTHEGVLGEWSTGDDKGELIGEHDLLEILAILGGASKLGKKNLLRSLVILTYEEVFEDVWSIGEDFLFLHGLLGNLCWLYPRGGFIKPTRIIFFITHKGIAIVPWTHGGVPSWYCSLLGICLKIWTHEGVLLVTYDLLKDAFDAFNLLWMLVWSLCLLPNWGHCGHFDMFLDFSFAFPTFREPNGDFEGFFFAKLHIV